jgi:hypothetical protein
MKDGARGLRESENACACLVDLFARRWFPKRTVPVGQAHRNRIRLTTSALVCQHVG